jgi:toxin ParE1/3/4
MQISWTALALRDLKGIYRYIAKDDPEAARQTAIRIENQVQQLARMQGIGRPGRVYGTRELLVQKTPYVVAYRVRSGVVDILAVIHSSRTWPKDFG